MEDGQIVELYWQRSEAAISETEAKYGKYCRAIAYQILRDREDSEECVNDTYMRAWNTMPPHRPSLLKTFLGKIVRNLSIDRYERRTAAKRGFGEIPLALDELRECVPAGNGGERLAEDLALAELIDHFLASLPSQKRMIFVQRYWYLRPIGEIAAACDFGESRVKVSLMRTRNGLRKFLEKEGISI